VVVVLISCGFDSGCSGSGSGSGSDGVGNGVDC